MKLSIIVPVYNVSEYLSVCVDSLINQTINDYEIILIDDGSTDNSPVIMDDYQKRFPEKVKTIYIDNGGQGRARNYGLDAASGEYIGFVDSDDWVSKDMYLQMYEQAVSNNSDIVVCDFIQSFSDGSEAVIPACFHDNPLSAAGSACNKLFSKKIIASNRFPVGIKYEDFEFSALMLMKAQNISFINKPFYYYRCGQTSTMHNNNSAMNLDLLKVMEHLKKYMGESSKQDEYEFFVLNHVLLEAVKRVSIQNSEDRSEVLQRLVSYVHTEIPCLSKCASYKKESLNRRIIMTLNYHGLSNVANILLSLKEKAGHKSGK